MKRYGDKHSPITRKDSTVPSWYSVGAPLSEPVSPHQLSLSCLSHRFKISLSLPPLALSAMPIPPSPFPYSSISSSSAGSVPVTLSLSLTCFFPPFLSLFMSVTHSLFLSLSHTLLPSPLPPAFCFAAMPLPAHLFCLFSSPPPLSPR